MYNWQTEGIRMSQSKDKFQINTEIQTIKDKLNYEDIDLMRFHNQTHSEVEAELYEYLSGLNDDWPKEFFTNHEAYNDYVEAKDEEVEEAEQQQVIDMYYQPSLFTEEIDIIISNKQNNLLDIRPNRYTIAMLLRTNDIVETEALVSLLIHNGNLTQRNSLWVAQEEIPELEDLVAAEAGEAVGLSADLELLKDDREKG